MFEKKKLLKIKELLFCIQSKEKHVTFYFCPSSSKWMKVRTVNYTTDLLVFTVHYGKEW